MMGVLLRIQDDGSTVTDRGRWVNSPTSASQRLKLATDRGR